MLKTVETRSQYTRETLTIAAHQLDELAQERFKLHTIIFNL